MPEELETEAIEVPLGREEYRLLDTLVREDFDGSFEQYFEDLIERHLESSSPSPEVDSNAA